jgi:hypothetical protein
MLKVSLETERSRQEKKRLKGEKDRIDNMVEQAKQSARIYLSSDEGRMAIREAARKELIQCPSKETFNAFRG